MKNQLKLHINIVYQNYNYKASIDNDLGLLSIDVNKLPKNEDKENNLLEPYF